MDKSHKNHCLVFDPISFKGGSKIATLEALGTVSAGQCQFTVVTATPKIWQDPTLTNRFSVKIIPLPLIRSMAKCHQGWGYWLNQLFFLGISVVNTHSFSINQKSDRRIRARYRYAIIYREPVLHSRHHPIHPRSYWSIFLYRLVPN